MTTTERPRVVAGFTLVRKVGSGGEGEVWEARAPDGSRRAVKLVRPEAVAEPEQVLVRGDWLRRISHPSLVRVRRTGLLAEHDLAGWGLVEMDFVDGEGLATAHVGAAALRWLQPLAAGLDALHAGRWSDGTPLVHRDVKPANLIATPSAGVVLVDCSSLCGVDRSLLTRVGTPLFAAPEVITGRIGPPADVYSFAATVVALVTGARRERLAAALDDPWSVDVPDPVRLALATDPTRRPRQCGVLLDPDVVRLDERWLPVHSLDPAAGAPGGPSGSPESTDPAVPEWLPAYSGMAAPALPAPAPPAPAPLVPVPPARPTVDTDPQGEPAPLPARPVAEAPVSPTLRAPDDAPGTADPMSEPPLRAVWPFVALLGAIGGLLAGAAWSPADLGVTWTVTAVAVSVVAHLGAGRRPWGAVLLPNFTWAALLAERSTRIPVRRAWVRDTVTGALTGGGIVAFRAVGLPGVAAGRQLLVVTVALTVLCTAATVAVARTRRRTIVSRFALLPLTLLGAAVLFGAAVVVTPFAGMAGRPGAGGRMARQALHGLAGVAVRGRGDDGGREDGAPGPHDPDGPDHGTADGGDPELTRSGGDWSYT